MREGPEDYFATEDLSRGIGRRAARAGLLVTGGRVVKGLVDLATTVFLAHRLPPEAHGLVGMVIAINRFVDVFKDLGLTAATVQQKTITRAQVNALFWINAAFGIAITAIIAASGPLVAWFYGESRLVAITAVLSAAIAVSSVSLQHQALLRRRMEFARLVSTEVVATIASSAVGIALAVAGFGYWALVYQTLALALAQTLATWVLCRFRPSRPARAEGVGALVRFGGHLTGFNLMNFLSRNVDNVIVGVAFGARALGLYAKAYDLMMLPGRELNAPVAGVAVPALARVADRPEPYRDLYQRALELLLLVAMPLGALLVMTSDWVIHLALGPRWTEAGPLFAILGCNVFTLPIANSLGWLLVTQNRGPHMLRLGIIATTTTIASFFVGLPWGVAGVATGYTIGHLLRTPLVVWYVTRQGPVKARDIWGIAAPMSLAAAISVAALWGLRHAWTPGSAALGLGVAIAVTLVTSLVGFALTATGRRALGNVARIRSVLGAE